MELELVDQELEFGFWLGVARQYQLASVSGRHMDVDHLDGGKLLDGAARAQPRRQRMQAALQCDVRTIGQEGDEDMGLDPPFLVMEDRSDGEVPFEMLWGFGGDEKMALSLLSKQGVPDASVKR